MERHQLLELWNDMWQEGNWVPSWPDSLAELTAVQAAWTPDAKTRSAWQEVVHVTFWRQVTLDLMEGRPRPSDSEVERREFAAPKAVSEEAWSRTVADLQRTQEAIAAAIANEGRDVSRLPYHLIHDAYHLGRVTLLRAMQGTKPTF